jgi:hypothetical protein
MADNKKYDRFAASAKGMRMGKQLTPEEFDRLKRGKSRLSSAGCDDTRPRRQRKTARQMPREVQLNEASAVIAEFCSTPEGRAAYAQATRMTAPTPGEKKAAGKEAAGPCQGSGKNRGGQSRPS